MTPTSMCDSVRTGIPRHADFGPPEVIDQNATQSLHERRTFRRRMWPAQRYALQLVAIDLFVGLAFLVFVLSKSPGEVVAKTSSIPLWLIIWVMASAAAGGFSPLACFSSRRQFADSIKLSLRSATFALAACCFFAFFLGIGLNEAGFIQVIITLALISGVARTLLTRVSPAKIMVVTRHHEYLPAHHGSGRKVRHLELTEAQLAEPKAFIDEIRENAKRFDASAVEIVGGHGISDSIWRSLSWELREQHISLRFPIEGSRFRQHRVNCAVEGGRAVIEIAAPVRPWSVRIAKRATDVIGASCLILVFLPLLVILASAIKATSPGPVLYGQERVGRGGRSFKILKFRTMADGSDAMLQSLLKAQNKGDTPLFKVANDPRITPLGKVLRRYSLDELPQLFNVLNGSMSLVGPRPQRPAEVALYSGDAEHRLGVRPGMTGLWQVSGRSRLSWEEGQEMDIDYAHNWSVWEDLRILMRTARAVIASDGAV